MATHKPKASSGLESDTDAWREAAQEVLFESHGAEAIDQLLAHCVTAHLSDDDDDLDQGAFEKKTRKKRAAMPVSENDESIELLSQALFIHGQSTLALQIQLLPLCSASLKTRYKRLITDVVELCAEMEFSTQAFEDLLLEEALRHPRTDWALQSILDLFPSLAVAPMSGLGDDTPLLRTMMWANPTAMQTLMQRGATINPNGRQVLTQLDCAHPHHPYIDPPIGMHSGMGSWRSGEDRYLPFRWLARDEALWNKLATPQIDEAFEAQYGEALRLAKERYGPDVDHAILDLLVGWARDGMARTAISLHCSASSDTHPLTGKNSVRSPASDDRPTDLRKETDVEFRHLPFHVAPPGREELLAALYLSHEQPLTSTMDAKMTASLQTIGIELTALEKEAILCLRLRRGWAIDGALASWDLASGEGRALWPALDQLRCRVPKHLAPLSSAQRYEPIPAIPLNEVGVWGALGSRLLERAAVLLQLSNGQKQHPDHQSIPQRWFASRWEADRPHLGGFSAETPADKLERVSRIVQQLLLGLDSIETLFPMETPVDRVRWGRQIHDVLATPVRGSGQDAAKASREQLQMSLLVDQWAKSSAISSAPPVSAPRPVRRL